MDHVSKHHGATKLTTIAVKNAKPADKRREISDGGNGLYLIVQPKPSGAKSWAVRYRYLDKPKKFTLGPVLTLNDGEREPENVAVGHALTLAAARKLAGDALHRLKQGKDPAAYRKQELTTSKEAAAKRAADSIEAMADEFIMRHVAKKNRPSTRQQVVRILNQEVLPAWRGRSLHDIDRGDVIKLLDDIAEDRPILANRTLAVVRAWFNWMIERNVLKTVSPCTGVKPPSAENARERVLSPEEIRKLWKACEEMGHPFGPFVKLLLLTGQRRSEVGDMRWSEIDEENRTWTLPGERTKNGEQHTVPLAPQAWVIIKSLPEIKNGNGEVDYVISTTGHSGVTGFSKAKKQIDEIVQARKPWTYHDVRRTVVTHLAEGWYEGEGDQKERFAVPPHVVEAVVNHITGHKSGVAGVYNRATYATEKRLALEKWANRIYQITKDGALAADKPAVKDRPAAKVIRPKFGGSPKRQRR
jgi:integrase